jgi:RecJ-like exonuclease
MSKKATLACLLAALLLTCASVGLGALETADYVGADRCRQCHPTAYAAWAGSLHARAQQALQGKQAGDARCTQCHGEAERRVAGVQCESCHGAGRHYAQRHVMKDAVLSRIVGLRDVDEKVCRTCHTATAPTVRSYDQDRMWRVIEHAREPRRSAAAPATAGP